MLEATVGLDRTRYKVETRQHVLDCWCLANKVFDAQILLVWDPVRDKDVGWCTGPAGSRPSLQHTVFSSGMFIWSLKKSS